MLKENKLNKLCEKTNNPINNVIHEYFEKNNFEYLSFS